MNDVILYGNSTKGRRENNEDCFLAEKINENTYLIAVADGMGGVNAGEIASALVSRRVSELFHKQVSIAAFNLKSLIGKAFTEAQSKVAVKIKEEPDLNGLGTTLICLIVHNDKIVWANLGDSRLYMLNDEGCKLLTTDHTYLNQLFAQGKSENEDRDIKKFGHILTRVIDGGKDLPDIFPENEPYLQLKGNELFFACSDGAILQESLRSNYWVEEIALASFDTTEFVQNLIDHAYSHGSTDNITVSAINLGYKFKSIEQIIQNKNSRRKDLHKNKSSSAFKKLLLGISISVFVSIIVWAGLVLYNNNFELAKFFDTNSDNIDEGLSKPANSEQSRDFNIASDSLTSAKKMEFFSLIEQGDKMSSNYSFSKALEFYEKAIVINPSDKGLQEKILDVEKKISYQSIPDEKTIEKDSKLANENVNLKKDSNNKTKPKKDPSKNKKGDKTSTPLPETKQDVVEKIDIKNNESPGKLNNDSLIKDDSDKLGNDTIKVTIKSQASPETN